jgi:hypothetical protein
MTQENFLHWFNVETFYSKQKEMAFSVANLKSIYTTLKFLALQGAPYIYDISKLRVKHAIHYTARKKYQKINIVSQHTITNRNNATTQTTDFSTPTWRNTYGSAEDETQVTALFSFNQLFQVHLVTVFQQCHHNNDYWFLDLRYYITPDDGINAETGSDV